MMDNIVVWGAGKCGKAYVDKLISSGIERDKIKLVDSDSKLYGGGEG